ncbi:MAG: alpha-hydroxy-acid oxidizing protein [Desulfobacteraceae bacterium]|nr:alpha-hydroxy-acid oxidizing protein [Desulfobacteraceae bacterium]
MKTIHDNARKLMKGFCRVCPRCNGKACAGEVPGMGGLGTGGSFRANLEALDSLRFNMRLIHDVSEPDTTTSLLGMDLALPVLAAPIGGVSFNMGGGISEQEYIQAVVRGCESKGILGCTGDGVPAIIHESGFEAIRSVKGKAIPFIKPWEDKELFEKLEKAEQTGADIVGMDIDAAGLITLKKMGRPVSPKGLDALKKIIKSTSMKFILKGVMTPDEALLAVEAGADAIVVSNHGGRVFDHTPGAARVLPGIVDKVKGKIAILADGGVRTGGDVLKLVALGADAVMIGRPFSIACVGGLREGVETLIDTIHGELKQSMVLTGTASIKAASPSILV